jgi:8-amino-7-oxononanoate synthase
MRERSVIQKLSDATLIHASQNYLNFVSNDYLGLSQHPSVIRAFQTAANQSGFGSGGSALICGYTPEHQALEEELAEFLNYEKVLLFSNGYLANLGVLSTFSLLPKNVSLIPKFFPDIPSSSPVISSNPTIIPSNPPVVSSNPPVIPSVARDLKITSKTSKYKTKIILDKFCHASLYDGASLAGVLAQRFLHNDMNHLQKKLASALEENIFIVTDGVYSMQGDIANLPEIIKLAQQYSAALIVDDAHGIGVLGKQGRGVLAHFHLSATEIPLLVGTFGKAFGGYGAFVAGSKDSINYLIQNCRTYIYTTALPPAVIAANRMSLKLIQQESDRRVHLNELIIYFQQCAQQLSLNFLSSFSAIQVIILGTAEKTLRVQQALKEKGLWVFAAVAAPTVTSNSARLRICLNALHNKSNIDYLLDNLAKALK